MNSNSNKNSHDLISESDKLQSYENMKNLLSDDGILEIEEQDNQVIIYFNNKAYASLQMDKNELVVQFIQPENLQGLENKLSYYSEVTNPRGWLEFRTFADNNYEDQFQAELGSFIGQILCELNSKR